MTEQEHQEELLKESFRQIRVQALDQCLELVGLMMTRSSDPRSIVILKDSIRHLVKSTKEGKL